MLDEGAERRGKGSKGRENGCHQEGFGAGPEGVEDGKGVVSAGVSWRVQGGKGHGLPKPEQELGLATDEGACVKRVSNDFGDGPGENHGGEKRVAVGLRGAALALESRHMSCCRCAAN